MINGGGRARVARTGSVLRGLRSVSC